MDSPRVILHLDLDAFFCAVEEIKDPDCVGKPSLSVDRQVIGELSHPAPILPERWVSVQPCHPGRLYCTVLI